MAELHESILVAFRKKFLKRGFSEAKSPMPTYRPDVFARKISRKGTVKEEIVVEAEIDSTLFSDHTSEQLVMMEEYIEHRARRRVPVKGYLVVPGGRNTLALAKSLLDSLGTRTIKIIQF